MGKWNHVVCSVVFVSAVLGLDGSRAQTLTKPPISVTDMQPRGMYALTYIKTDRKWRYGLRSEPYDKISEELASELEAGLDIVGIKRKDDLSGAECCRVTIELLEVTTHPAMVKKPGVDVAATITVTGADKKSVFAKGYRGESRTLMNTYGHLIDHAVEDLARHAAADEDLIKSLTAPRP